jgi:hypothetical protein
MKRLLLLPLFVILFSCFAGIAAGQTNEQKRDATREKLRQLLESAGEKADINTNFRQSSKQPYNFVGMMRDGMNFNHVDGLEIVISVTKDETIGIRVYPHYKGEYINVSKAKDPLTFAKKLLNFSDHNFLFWGLDDTGDTFAGYTFTLESGFPTDAIVIVLRSIRNTDGFVGELKPFFDGISSAPATTHKGF